MKNTTLRFLAFLMMLIILSFSAVHAGGAQHINEKEGRTVYFDRSSLYPKAIQSSVSSLGVNSSAFSGTYYNQLDSNSKIAYNAIYNGYINGATDELISIPLNKTFEDVTIIISGNTFDIHPDDIAVIETWLLDVCYPALVAIGYDHPETYWLDYGGYYSPLFDTVYTSVTSGSIVTDLEVLSVVFSLDPASNYEGSPTYITNAVNNAKAVIDSRLSPSADNVTILKEIQKYICENVSYTTSSDIYDRYYQTVYSAFYGNRDTVCAGYSKAFKLICDKYGIPCILVHGFGLGERHMWNYVQLNGDWYAIDTTWDDNSYSASYNYFLVGSSTVVDYMRFDRSHTPDTTLAPYFTYSFNIPTLSTVSYDEAHSKNYVTGDVDGDGFVTMTDLLAMRKYMLGIFTDDDINVEAASVTYGDSSVSMIDLLNLRKFMLGLITVFPADA